MAHARRKERLRYGLLKYDERLGGSGKFNKEICHVFASVYDNNQVLASTRGSTLVGFLLLAYSSANKNDVLTVLKGQLRLTELSSHKPALQPINGIDVPK